MIAYSLLSTLFGPFYLLALYFRGNSGRLSHRLGFIPRTDKPTIWVHASSMGEVASLRALLSELHKEHPHHTLLVTTNTTSGYRYTCEHFPFATAAFVPLDTPFTVWIALQRITLKRLLVTEAERWICLFKYAHRTGARVTAYNARVRTSTMRSWSKRASYRATYKYCTSIKSQNIEPFRQLGLPESVTLESMGSPKAASVLIKRKTYGNPTSHSIPVLLVGSVHENELLVYINLWKALKKAKQPVHLILVPRHLNWTQTLQQQVNALKTVIHHFDVVTGDSPETVKKGITQHLDTPGITTVAVMGALYDLYAHATVFCLGGTFNDIGGHNVLEPAVWALPVLSGPNISETNYEALALERTGGLQRMHSDGQLARYTLELLQHLDVCQDVGKKNAAWLKNQAAS